MIRCWDGFSQPKGLIMRTRYMFRSSSNDGKLWPVNAQSKHHFQEGRRVILKCMTSSESFYGHYPLCPLPLFLSTNHCQTHTGRSQNKYASFVLIDNAQVERSEEINDGRGGSRRRERNGAKWALKSHSPSVAGRHLSVSLCMSMYCHAAMPVYTSCRDRVPFEALGLRNQFP